MTSAAPTITRPDIWRAVRALSREGVDITAPRVYAHLSGQTKPVPHRIGEYLRALAAGAYLTRHDSMAGVYTLTRDIGSQPPMLRADGSEVKIGIGRRRMWDVMRVLKVFSALDLAVHASVDDHVVAESDAAYFCRALTRVGLLTRQDSIAPARWAIPAATWTGPQPPRVHWDGSVLDRNTGRLHRPRTGRAARTARTEDTP